MKIILLKDVRKLGKKFEIKDVADGFALNSLIPQKLAIVATADNVKRIDLEKKKHEAEAKVHEDLLMKNLAQIDGKEARIVAKADEKGHLFASIHADQIIAALKASTHAEVAPEHLDLEKPIKSTGKHTLSVAVGSKKASFTLIVEAE